MRRLKLSAACSLDAYIAGVDGSYDWIRRDADYRMEEFFASVDVALIGRKTFEMARRAKQPFFSSMTNYVFSTTLPAGRDDDVEIVAAEPAGFVRELKSQAGKDIWLFGGYGLTSSLLIAGEVDEMRLAVQPVLLGDGIPLFPRLQDRRAVELLESKAYGNGVVVLRYAMLH